MNAFDTGFEIGRFFVSWVINEKFCGFTFEIGKSKDINSIVINLQIGYGMFLLGFDMNKEV